MSTQIYTDEQKQQFSELLAAYPDEVAGLRAALIDGNIDGAWYGTSTSSCGCVIGTIARLRHQSPKKIMFFNHCEISPIEELVYGIHEGDTPETNPVSALLVQWIDERQPAVDTKSEE